MILLHDVLYYEHLFDIFEAYGIFCSREERNLLSSLETFPPDASNRLIVSKYAQEFVISLLVTRRLFLPSLLLELSERGLDLCRYSPSIDGTIFHSMLKWSLYGKLPLNHKTFPLPSARPILDDLALLSKAPDCIQKIEKDKNARLEYVIDVFRTMFKPKPSSSSNPSLPKSIISSDKELEEALFDSETPNIDDEFLSQIALDSSFVLSPTPDEKEFQGSECVIPNNKTSSQPSRLREGASGDVSLDCEDAGEESDEGIHGEASAILASFIEASGIQDVNPDQDKDQIALNEDSFVFSLPFSFYDLSQIVDSTSSTVWHLFLEHGYLLSGIHIDYFYDLLTGSHFFSSFDILYAQDSLGRTPLHVAVLSGCSGQVVSALVSVSICDSSDDAKSAAVQSECNPKDFNEGIIIADPSPTSPMNYDKIQDTSSRSLNMDKIRNLFEIKDMIGYNPMLMCCVSEHAPLDAGKEQFDEEEDSIPEMIHSPSLNGVASPLSPHRSYLSPNTNTHSGMIIPDEDKDQIALNEDSFVFSLPFSFYDLSQIVDSTSSTVWHLFLEHGYLLSGIHIDYFYDLLTGSHFFSSFDILYAQDSLGRTPLHVAVLSGCSGQVVSALVSVSICDSSDDAKSAAVQSECNPKDFNEGIIIADPSPTSPMNYDKIQDTSSRSLNMDKIRNLFEIKDMIGYNPMLMCCVSEHAPLDAGKEQFDEEEDSIPEMIHSPSLNGVASPLSPHRSYLSPNTNTHSGMIIPDEDLIQSPHRIGSSILHDCSASVYQHLLSRSAISGCIEKDDDQEEDRQEAQQALDDHQKEISTFEESESLKQSAIRRRLIDILSLSPTSVLDRTCLGNSSLHCSVQHGCYTVVNLLIDLHEFLKAEKVPSQSELEELISLISTIDDPYGSLEADKKEFSLFNSQNIALRTPLHLSAISDPECSSLLLRCGSFLNTKDISKRSPLHLASASLSAETTELFLRHGSNANETDSHGDTPLHAACIAVMQRESIRLEQEEEKMRREHVSEKDIIRARAKRMGGVGMRNMITACVSKEELKLSWKQGKEKEKEDVGKDKLSTVNIPLSKVNDSYAYPLNGIGGVLNALLFYGAQINTKNNALTLATDFCSSSFSVSIYKLFGNAQKLRGDAHARDILDAEIAKETAKKLSERQKQELKLEKKAKKAGKRFIPCHDPIQTSYSHVHLNNLPTWILDDFVDDCMCCGQQFGVTRRKHHCRKCGRCVCASCSDRKVPLLEFGYQKDVKVCDLCIPPTIKE
ncbi:hypothetical protein ADUPG1_000360 [Aduncisulcus paluster]|uniref:FYVE-type domain-containing protein n=1 Tax=Aduncisulcus paluster TaxID=2918883 RepID=A0ABQ5K628_9EUKA|nr:hypothetical protein ADUPG1_000360 [Aduncisulcus paluster]